MSLPVLQVAGKPADASWARNFAHNLFPRRRRVG